MKRVTLHVSGNVQTAGYRARVIDIARAFGITGVVANLPDGRVKVIAEGEATDLERFIQAINIKNALINVTDIEKEYSPPTGEYDGFYKLVGEGETDERLDTAASLLKELINVTKNGFDNLGKKQDIMIEKQDIMIEKQDKMLEKQDETIAKIDQSREEITSELRSLRGDFRSLFDERISRIEHDLAEIKSKIATLQ